MPEVSSKTPADRALANATNMRSKINGDMEITPTNFFKNWHFNDINEDGHPDCLRVGAPEKPDGWWVYLSEAGGAPSTMAAQNAEPIPIHEVSYVTSETWVGGKGPVSQAFAAEIAAPDPPGYEIINATRGGFASGVWYVAYTWNDQWYRQTLLSPATSVTLTTGQGFLITVPDVPEHVKGLNIYVGRDPSYLQLQAHFSFWVEAHEFVKVLGPFKQNPPPPTLNQTKQLDPRQPGISFVSANTTLQPGTYTARAAAVEATGTTAPSQATDAVTVGTPMPNTALEVDPGYSEDCAFDDDESSDFVDASVRHKILITKDGTEYLGYDASRGSPERTLSSRDTLALSGYTQNDAPSDNGWRYLLGFGTIPTESNDEHIGVPTPDAPLDDISPIGLAVLDPANYWFAVSYSVRGKESMVSTPQKVTLPSTKMLRIIFPDTVNVIPDPNVFERDSSGIPLSHVLVSGVGSATAHPNEGSIILDTLGTITTASQTAPSHYVEFPVNRAFTYQIGATMVVSALSAGSVVEELQEYDESSTLLATTTLITVSGTGTVKPISKFGPGATGWQQATVTARLTHRFSGATVNGKVTLSEFKALPTDANYRKTIFPPKFVREPGQPDVTPQTPHPRSAQWYIGPPPSSLATTPSPSQVVDAFDFETNTMPGSWTVVNTNTSACSQSITSSAAIGGSLGWQVRKTTTATGYVYMERTFTPSNRTTIAVRAKFRIRAIPGYQKGARLFKITPQSVAAGIRNPLLGQVYLYGSELWYDGVAANGAGISYYLTNVVGGDILDIEMIAKKTGNGGNINVALGKNGATRVFKGWKGQFDWTGVYPTTVQLGFQYSASPSFLAQVDIDNVVITDSGDSLSSGSLAPALQPVTAPDRPFGTAVQVESEYTFETGTIPAAFAQTRTPADSTTTLAAQTASAIVGTYGVRAADTGTATTANVYIERTLSATRASLGARARYRVVTRPTAGEVQLLALADSAGTLLGAITLDSTGVLYARPYSGGVAGTSQAIATGVSNTNVLHLDLVAQYTGTTGGLLSAWVQVNGSGNASARQLMFQKSALDWSAGQVQKGRFGGFNESSASSTWSFDIDSILFTEVGETAFSENWNQGPIYQAHIFFPAGTPVSDKWGLRAYREAVLPGGQYTAAIKARFTGVANACYPCYFTAYDTDGGAHPLGSIFDNVFPSGVSGTVAWADYSNTFAIPDDCYEVRMDSKGMGEGEYVFQEFAFSLGTSAVREVTYPATGTAFFTLDTLGAVPDKPYAALGRAWQTIGGVVNTPVGTSHATTYQSRAEDGSIITAETSDPDALAQGRYADFTVSLSGDTASTPTLKRGSPYIRYSAQNGAQQVATLLRYDRSEFYGGTIVTELGMPYLKTPHGVRVLPSGRVARQRMGDPVGFLPDCIIGVFTEEAAREIQETCLDDDFYIETRDKLYRIRFAQEIIFDPPLSGSLARYAANDWRLWAEAETGDAEILEFVDYTIA